MFGKHVVPVKGYSDRDRRLPPMRKEILEQLIFQIEDRMNQIFTTIEANPKCLKYDKELLSLADKLYYKLNEYDGR